MSTGATIAQIKAGLIAAYQGITLPGGLGTPTVIGREMDGNPPTLPYVEVHTNPSQSIAQPRGEDSYQVTRSFIVRVYIKTLPDDTPSVEITDYELADSCVETVEDYFYLSDDRLDVAFVVNHRIVADTGGIRLFTRDNDNYVGVAFDHAVTYYRQR